LEGRKINENRYQFITNSDVYLLALVQSAAIIRKQ